MLLEMFVRGLPEGTILDKKILPTEEDHKNSPTHLVLVINARDVYKNKKEPNNNSKGSNSKGWTGWFRWWGNDTDSSETNNIIKLTDLYKRMVDHLSKHRYKNNGIAAAGKVIVLVTHLDMIPKPDREQFKSWITSQFTQNGVSENFILFGEKQCDWDYNALAKHDEEVDRFLTSLSDNDNYWDKLPEWPDFKNTTKKLPGSWWLHYGRSTTCKKEGCTHEFTKDTTDRYTKLFSVILGAV